MEVINEGKYMEKNIYKMLDSTSPSEQMEGERLARELEDLSLLITPPAPPYVWEKCAKILSEKDDCELEPYLPGLLGWLHDLNWPGAECIFQRLTEYKDSKWFCSVLDMCIDEATALKEEIWLEVLIDLKKMRLKRVGNEN